MSDDGSRSALFAGASSRAGGKPNPYADSGTAAGASSGAPAPAAPAPAAPAPAPASTTGLTASSLSSALGVAEDDASRASLFGDRRPGATAGEAAAPAAAAAEPVAVKHLKMDNFSFGGLVESAVAAAARGEGDEDDGALEFDFEGLDMTTGAHYARTSTRLGPSGSGPGAFLAAAGGATSPAAGFASPAASSGAGGEDIDFSAIDADLTRFQTDPVITEALAATGLDLRTYARQVDADLRALEMASIADYVGEADAIAELYEQVEDCEAVLERMRGMLGAFQSNLGGMAREIRALQEQSLGLSVSMTNRKALHSKLRTFLTKVAVPEALIASICEGPMEAEAWWKDLALLSQKIRFTLQGTSRATGGGGSAPGWDAPAPGDAAAPAEDDDLSDLSISPFATAAGRDAAPQIDRLRSKAVARLRDFLVKHFAELSRPKSNLAKYQEYTLLKYAAGMAFLSDHAPDVARDLRSAYADGVGSTLAGVFKKYADDLKSVAIAPPGRADASLLESTYVPSLSAGAGGGGGGSGAGAAASTRLDPFSLGGRPFAPQGGVDADPDAAPIAAHVAVADRVRMPFEVVWRHLLRHFVDVVASESSFALRFFGPRWGPEAFTLTLSRSVSTLCAVLEEYLMTGHDAIGAVGVIAATASMAKLAVSPKYRRSATAAAGGGAAAAPPLPPNVDTFYARVGMLAWGRVRTLLEGHVGALRAATPPAGAAAGAAAVLKRVGALDPCAVHLVTRRVADLSTTLLAQHQGLVALLDEVAAAGDAAGEGLPPCLTRGASPLLDAAFPALLQELTSAHTTCLMRAAAAELAVRTPRQAFLANQYAACVSAASARRLVRAGPGTTPLPGAPPAATAGADAAAATTVEGAIFGAWEAGLKAALEAYTSAELETHFRGLVAFVRGAEAAAAKAAGMLQGASSDGAASGEEGAPAPPPIGSIPESIPVVVDAADAEARVREFNAAWRAGLKLMNDNVMRYFNHAGGAAAAAAGGAAPGASSGAAGAAGVGGGILAGPAPSAAAMSVLKRVLQAFVSTYERFQVILARAFGAPGGITVGGTPPPAFLREVTPIATVYYDLKKYSLAGGGM